MNANIELSRRELLGAASFCLTSHLAATATASDEKKPEAACVPLLDCHLHISHYKRSIEDTIRHMDATGTNRAFILPLETGEGGLVLRGYPPGPRCPSSTTHHPPLVRHSGGLASAAPRVPAR